MTRWSIFKLLKNIGGQIKTYRILPWKRKFIFQNMIFFLHIFMISLKFFIETNSCCLAMATRLKMRKNEEDHNDSVKRKCLFKIQLRTTFCCYSRKHAYAKCLYRMYWSIFQHIKTTGWTKESHVEIPSCTKRHSNGHSFSWYCIKVKDTCSLFNQFILKKSWSRYE